MPNRQSALNKWLAESLGTENFSYVALAGDASFRHYYRLQHGSDTRIIMDAPPDKEPMHTFLAVDKLLSTHGVRAPHIYAADESLGFALLEDFGDELLLNVLSEHNASAIYQAAIQSLLQIQTCPTTLLPCFDQNFMQGELSLFRQWFLGAYLQLSLSPSEEALLAHTFNWLTAEIAKQPSVFVHRDYHSRNLMLLANTTQPSIGVIDFQDAMLGPITYDLVSLLKDCYIQWPRALVMQMVNTFYEHSAPAQQVSLPVFVRGFDLAGLQRHLKVLGIFSRLWLRDGKQNYLQHLPLILHYLRDCLESYEELQAFYHFVQERIQLP